MQSEFIERVSSWINADPDNLLGLRGLKSKIDFLTDILYGEYRPTLAGTHGEFKFRLAQWIDSAPNDAQRKLMFMLLDYLFFVGKHEFDAMYMTAYSRHIAQWILFKEKINLSACSAWNEVRSALNKTLYTAITDSFNIGDFIRLNSIQGISTRFIWEQALKIDWDQEKFESNAMIGKNKIVLLEDFVGSGSQMRKSVIAACELPSKPQVLLCPLIICPAGADLARQLCLKYDNLTYSPVLELSRKDFIAPRAQIGEPALFNEIRTLVTDIHPYVSGNEPWLQNYGPFGYGETGALIVKYDNCPDNTLPLIHRKSDTPWNPLFFRVSREAL